MKKGGARGGRREVKRDNKEVGLGRMGGEGQVGRKREEGEGRGREKRW